MRFIPSLFAVFALWLLATASLAPASATSLPFSPTSSDSPATLQSASLPPFAAAVSLGALEDWDDEAKSALPKFEAPSVYTQVHRPDDVAFFSPHRVFRHPDRRAITLVGTVVLVI